MTHKEIKAYVLDSLSKEGIKPLSLFTMIETPTELVQFMPSRRELLGMAGLIVGYRVEKGIELVEVLPDDRDKRSNKTVFVKLARVARVRDCVQKGSLKLLPASEV